MIYLLNIIFFLSSFLIIKNLKIIFKNGSGILLIILFLELIIFDFNNQKFYLYIILLSLIYFIDDIYRLPAIVRIFIQIALGYLIFSQLNDNNLFILLLCIGVSVLLVNTTNFQDGLNLNIGSYIIQFIIIIYIYHYFDLVQINSFILVNLFIFLILFIPFNVKYNFYFGDSGCFIFTSIVLIFFSMNNFYSNILVFLNIFLFPFIDTSFVTLLRFQKKENLLTRNFYHLYHKIYEKNKGYYYLLPPIINNFVLCTLIVMFDFNMHLKIFLIMIFTLLIYLFTRIFINKL